MCPLPDPSNTLAASQIQFDELHREVEILTSQLSGTKSTLSMVVKETTGDKHRAIFETRMRQFLSQSKLHCNNSFLLMLMSCVYHYVRRHQAVGTDQSASRS